MEAIEAPGVKILDTPSSVSFGMSASGMMPPPNTSTSSALCSFRRSITLGKSVMCAPDNNEQPTASASSWITASTTCSGVW